MASNENNIDVRSTAGGSQLSNSNRASETNGSNVYLVNPIEMEIIDSSQDLNSMPGSYPSEPIVYPTHARAWTRPHVVIDTVHQQLSNPAIRNIDVPTPLNTNPEYHQYYPPPQQYAPRVVSGAQLFRYKTQQTIPLTLFGNLVVDVPVPRKVFDHARFPFPHLILISRY